MPWISRKDFYYYDSQNGKQPLVDIHGFGVSANTHFKEATFPLEKHYRLVIPEYPAHGKLQHITKADQQYLLSYLGNFIESLRLRNFKIIGRSVGGVLALGLSDKYKVKNTVIIEAPLVEYDLAFNPAFRIIAKITSKFPNFFMLNCEHKCVLKEVRNIKIDKETLGRTNAKFIYSGKDLYLTDENKKLIARLGMPLYIQDDFAHFRDQTQKSAVDLVLRLLET